MNPLAQLSNRAERVATYEDSRVGFVKRKKIKVITSENTDHECAKATLPVIEIQVIDGRLAIHFDPSDSDGLVWIPTSETIQIEAFGICIRGKVDLLQIEHNTPTLWVEPCLDGGSE